MRPCPYVRTVNVCYRDGAFLVDQSSLTLSVLQLNKPLLVKPFADVMMTWVCALYCRRVHSSYEVAKRTVQLLRNIVSTLKYSSAK